MIFFVKFTFIFLMRHCVADEPWSRVANHTAWKRLSTLECGESAADRIIGGINAALGQFPWIARLGYVFPGEKEVDFMCGGTLVTDRHVVTAAHCVQAGENSYKLSVIRLGEHDARTNPDCQMRVCAPVVQDRPVKSIQTHSSFNQPPFHNDIAIIELATPVQLTDYVSPICLPNENELKDLKVGELVAVAGWGTMNMSTEERADVLQVISLPVVQPDVCDSFGKGFKLTKSEICAGAQKNKDACGGDSGGPLMKVSLQATKKGNRIARRIAARTCDVKFENVFDTPDGPKNFLVGVVSFGPAICGIKKPGVYASVSYFLKWILDTLSLT